MTSKQNEWHLKLGANLQPDGSATFRVWAPRAGKLDLRLMREGHDDVIEMQVDEQGYFSTTVQNVQAGTKYFYVINNEKERPDPASRSQPLGVHGPSEVIDPNAFVWHDSEWRGLKIEDCIIYELHIGTFTLEGTFEAAIEKLDHLKGLGITCIQVMPIAQFPGERNWGYDGVSLFAPQNSYGGVEGFKKLVDACHVRGLALCLDVVYNHLGPEGNYLSDFGPYFTGKYNTPWGDAVNYDDMGSNKVRKWMVDNGLYWMTEYHVDALRLDAIHAIHDSSAVHFLAQFNEKLKSQAKVLGRNLVTIAESDLNDVKVVLPISEGGYGFDAQWSDDFHHAVHAKLTGEDQSYYQDYSGLKDIATTLSNPFLYEGQYSAFRQRRYGSSAGNRSAEAFIVCTQNHDQVGNRALGDRLSSMISFEMQKLKAVLQLINLYTPMLWMGQEYGEEAPFQYFIDHGDEGLVKSVREGRKREYISVRPDLIPDPDARETFEHSKLHWEKTSEPKEQFLLALYSDLLSLRRQERLKKDGRNEVQTTFDEEAGWLAARFPRQKGGGLACLFAFGKNAAVIANPFGQKKFELRLRTDAKKYGGSSAMNDGLDDPDCFKLAPETAWVGSLKE